MRLSLAAFAFAAALAAAPALASGTPEEILAANKQAMGGAAWDTKQAVRIDGVLTGSGLSGTTTSLNDLHTGRSRTDFRYGPAEGGGGFDGTTPWKRDTSGAVTEQKGGDGLALAINDAYRTANGWWAPGFGGAAVTSKGEAADAGRRFDVLVITPRGGKPFDAWFDSQTHLLTKLIEQQGAETVTTLISDYRWQNGVLMPFVFAIDAGIGPNYVQRVTVTKAVFEQLPADSVFAPQPQTAAGFTLPGGETTIPVKILNNHVYGDIRLNGQGPFSVLFDTGAHNIITPQIAAALGLKTEGRLPGTGAGEGTMEGSLTRGVSLAIGKAGLADQLFFVFPVDRLSEIEGQALPGVIGYETFSRFVTRFDYATGTLSLIDPAKFDPKDAGTAVPFEFNDHMPEVKGSFEGIAATFDIDTGSRAELTITKPFAEAHHLRESHPKGVTAMEGWGVGGPLTGYVTRGRAMTLGPVSVGPVVATLADQDKGLFAGASYSGNAGGGILKRFTVTFDYTRKVLYLKPRPTLPADTASYDRAGLWLNQSGSDFRVVAVTPNTPASEAGVLAGDVVTAVDAKPSGTLNLDALRRFLRTAPPGTAVIFTVSRGGKAASVKLVLRDLI